MSTDKLSTVTFLDVQAAVGEAQVPLHRFRREQFCEEEKVEEEEEAVAPCTSTTGHASCILFFFFTERFNCFLIRAIETPVLRVRSVRKYSVLAK